MKGIIKKSISYLLAFIMVVGFVPKLSVPFIYALDNIAAQTDFSDAADLDLSGIGDYIIKLPSGTTTVYNKIILNGTVTVKGTGTLIANSISGGSLLMENGNVYANTVSNVNNITVEKGTFSATTISDSFKITSTGNIYADSISAYSIVLSGGTMEVVDTVSISGYFTMNTGKFSTTTFKSSSTVTEGYISLLNVEGGEVLISEAILNKTESINLKNGDLNITNLSGGCLYVDGGVLKSDTIASCPTVKITNGQFTANVLESDSLTISGGIVEVKDLFGYTTTIDGGNISVDTLKWKVGNELNINDGTLNVTNDIVCEGTYGGYNDSGSVYFNGGKINVGGNIKAGNAASESPSLYPIKSAYGGSVTIAKDTDITVYGNIIGGQGAKGYNGYQKEGEGGIGKAYNGTSGGKGGDVCIYSGKFYGSISGGTGGESGTGNVNALPSGGVGGTVTIYGGEINGDIFGGNGGNGGKASTKYVNYDTLYYCGGNGGNCGDVIINGGIVNAPERISVDRVGKNGGSTYTSDRYALDGAVGNLRSESNGTAFITSPAVPTKSYFKSGVIYTNSDLFVYGNQTVSKSFSFDECDQLYVAPDAEMLLKGAVMNINGELKNNGRIIVDTDAEITGDGTYIYNDLNISIPELKEKLVAGTITLPGVIVYDGKDHRDNISLESNDAYGIKFMSMDLSEYTISLSYSRTSDGEKISTDIAKNAGCYSIMLNNSLGEPVASKFFEITRKGLSVESVKLTENDHQVNSIIFKGLVDGETLELGTDYTVSDIVFDGEIVTGVITLLDTPVAQNYVINDNGSFSCDTFEYTHVHNMEWKYNSEQHWQECACGERGTASPHFNDEGYEGVITTEPTEEKAGVRTFYCKECGYAYRTESVAYEHIHAACGDWVSDETYHWHICKCAEEGVVFDKAVHQKDSGIIIKEATESEEGIMRYCCSVCGVHMNDVAIPVISPQSGKCGENLFWTLDANGTLTISGSGRMDDYNYANYAPWYAIRKLINTVIINNGAANIGSCAFYDLTNLSSVSMPDSLETIGSSAFQNCEILTQISIPDSVITMGNGVFRKCYKLENVKLPKELSVIIESTFEQCISLKTIQIPQHVTSIGKKAFYNCSELSSISIPDSVTNIGISAFSGCKVLSDVVLGKNIKNIEYWAFNSCYSLESIKIPDGTETLENEVFYLSGLKAITIPAGVTFAYDTFDLCRYLTHIHIPYGKLPSDYFGQGGLPSSESYYHVLDENGRCSDKNCPMNLYSPAESIVGVEVNTDNIVVSYGNAEDFSVSRTVVYDFDKVNVDIVDYMANTNMQLVIDFVNNFSAAENYGCLTMTDAQVKAIEYVLEFDYNR